MGMAARLIEVKCPCCDAMLKIDPQLEVVISHEEPVKAKPIEDLALVLFGGEGLLEDLFAAAGLPFQLLDGGGEVFNGPGLDGFFV